MREWNRMSMGGVVWLTGIPASGKSTIAAELSRILKARKCRVEILDGDEVRETLCRGLGFSKADRDENVLRIAQIARLLARNGVWAIVALVSPYAETRVKAARISRVDGVFFLEVHVRCSRETAERRDPKGLYARARRGEIQNFTGISDPYEPPQNPGLALDTDAEPPGQCADRIFNHVLLPEAPFGTPPVVLLGRGSSGTRLLSRMAQDLGLFVGNELNETEDTLEFVDLVYWLARETVCESPLPSGSSCRDLIREVARKMLRKADIPVGAPWGWKLPETMLVLPLMVDAFPNARVIHLVRDPVTCSAGRAHITANLEHDLGRALLPASYRHCGRDISSIETDEQWMRSAISWEHQVGRIARWCRKKLDATAYMELKYEAVIQDPASAADRVADFLGHPRIRWSPAIDPGRATSRDADSHAGEVWGICGDTGALLGYPPPEAPVTAAEP